MIRELNISLTPEEAADHASLERAAVRKLKISRDTVTAVRIRRKSIDARRREVRINLSIAVYSGETPPPLYVPAVLPDVSGARRSAVVVGFGPAGIFAAITLIEQGIRPIVLERGRDVHQRLRDTGRLSREGILDPESNYAFGEGGAGAFSDGKLYTRSVKRGDTGRILRYLVQFGADESILYESHPHIGSDKLPYIIERMRNAIIAAGGEVCFSSRVVRLIARGDEVAGAVTSDGREYMGPVILATGHSAKDVYGFLHSGGYALEAKSTAAGVRLEHPQALIDSMQYHAEGKRSPFLPPASYSFVTQASGRGVYSFCMCPGGVIVPAASEEGHQVVNGMSPSSRGGRWANSGMIVELRKEELEYSDPFAMLREIEAIERACYSPGFTAPAERLTDFLSGREPSSLPASSYPRPLAARRMDEVLPSVIASSLREGLSAFGRMTGGRFISSEALLIAPETRTSSPVRILRDEGMKQGRGLYPAGEGAGYAGGIVSAAVDGTEAALRLGGDYAY